MAGVKISALPALVGTTLADIYPTVQAGVTYKVTLAQLLEQSSTNQAVRLASTAALTATYANGTAGVGATLTNAGALAALTIDGVAVAASDRILIKNQASAFQNGVYTVTTVGDGATAWVLTRATDYDEAGDIDQGDSFTVGAGTVNAKTQWLQVDAGPFTMGTTAINFESNVVAGTGITKTNNTVALTVPVAMANGGTNKVMVASNGAIVYSDADSLELSAVGSSGTLFQSSGAGAPAWTTSTYPATNAINTLLYASAANTMAALAATNRAVLGSSATGVPNWLALTDGQIVIGSTAGAPAATSLTAGANITITPGSNSITIASSGNVVTTEVVGASQSMAVNNRYIANNAGLVTLTLPATAAVGDMVEILGKGAGGWLIAQNAGDSIHIGSVVSTVGVGGSVASTNRYDSVKLVCITANDEWACLGGPQSAGLTIV